MTTSAVQRKINDTIALFENDIGATINSVNIINIILGKITEINKDRQLKRLSSPEVIDAFQIVSDIYASLKIPNIKNYIESTINKAVTEAIDKRTPSSIATKYIYEKYLSQTYTGISLVTSTVAISSFKNFNQTKLNGSIKAIINNKSKTVNQKELALNDLLRHNINYKNYTLNNQNIFNAKLDNAKIKIHNQTKNANNSLRSLGNYINNNNTNNTKLNNFKKYNTEQETSIKKVIKAIIGKYTNDPIKGTPKLQKLVTLLSEKYPKFDDTIIVLKNLINEEYIKKFKDSEKYKEITLDNGKIYYFNVLRLLNGKYMPLYRKIEDTNIIVNCGEALDPDTRHITECKIMHEQPFIVSMSTLLKSSDGNKAITKVLLKGDQIYVYTDKPKNPIPVDSKTKFIFPPQIRIGSKVTIGNDPRIYVVNKIDRLDNSQVINTFFLNGIKEGYTANQLKISEQDANATLNNIARANTTLIGESKSSFSIGQEVKIVKDPSNKIYVIDTKIRTPMGSITYKIKNKDSGRENRATYQPGDLVIARNNVIHVDDFVEIRDESGGPYRVISVPGFSSYTGFAERDFRLEGKSGAYKADALIKNYEATRKYKNDKKKQPSIINKAKSVTGPVTGSVTATLSKPANSIEIGTNVQLKDKRILKVIEISKGVLSGTKYKLGNGQKYRREDFTIVPENKNTHSIARRVDRVDRVDISM